MIDKRKKKKVTSGGAKSTGKKGPLLPGKKMGEIAEAVDKRLVNGQGVLEKGKGGNKEGVGFVNLGRQGLNLFRGWTREGSVLTK